MSTFSFSAPLITTEQEKVERDNLSSEELSAVDADVHGRKVPGAFEENETLIQRGPSLFAEALEALPEDVNKREYLEALEQCPEIVEQEMDPIVFLRSKDFDAHAAAVRATKYWKMRKKVFGDKAYLPMTQEGAMVDSLDTLNKGIMTCHGHDQHGRAVFHIWRTQMHSGVASRNEILRVVFYVLHSVISHDEVAQKNGVVFITNLKFFNISQHWDRLLTKMMMDMLYHCMPIKIKCFHGCFASAGRSVSDIIFPVVKHITGKWIRLRICVHGGADNELVDDMKQYGITVDNMPECLGGTGSLKDYLTWLEYQRAIEENCGCYYDFGDDDEPDSDHPEETLDGLNSHN